MVEDEEEKKIIQIAAQPGLEILIGLEHHSST